MREVDTRRLLECQSLAVRIFSFVQCLRVPLHTLISATSKLKRRRRVSFRRKKRAARLAATSGVANGVIPDESDPAIYRSGM
jgi:hypothetical protein